MWRCALGFVPVYLLIVTPFAYSAEPSQEYQQIVVHLREFGWKPINAPSYVTLAKFRPSAIIFSGQRMTPKDGTLVSVRWYSISECEIGAGRTSKLSAELDFKGEASTLLFSGGNSTETLLESKAGKLKSIDKLDVASVTYGPSANARKIVVVQKAYQIDTTDGKKTFFANDYRHVVFSK